MKEFFLKTVYTKGTTMNAEQTFLQCYEEYSDSIFRFCYLKVSNRETALDLTQEAFMRFWDVCLRGEKIAYPRALLFTTARNLVIDYYRKKKSDSLEVLEESGFQAEDAQDIEEETEYKEALEVIQKMEVPCRDLLIFRYVEGLPPREIADIVSEKVNTVSVRITRCMEKLRSLMKTT